MVSDRLFEWLYGVPPADPGQGTVWRFSHSFPWPAWAAVLFGLAAALLVVFVYRRDAARLGRGARALLIGLRLALVAAVLWFLAEVTLSVERTGLPYLVVLIDVSASMGTPDRYETSGMAEAASRLVEEAGLEGGATRLNLVKARLLRDGGALIEAFRRDNKVRIYTFASGVSWLGGIEIVEPEDVEAILPRIRELTPSGDQTRPGVALQAVLNELRGTRPSAVVVFSDGVTTTTDAERLSAAAEQARARHTPVFTVGVGNDEPLRDLALYDTVADDVAFVNDPFTVTSKIKSSGFSGQNVEVVLRVADTDRELASRTITLGDGSQPEVVEVTHTPTETGEFELELVVKPLPREFRTDNNAERFQVSVREEKIQVLYVEREPRYEYRYLKHVLEREKKTIELSVLLQDADPEYADEDESAIANFPVQKEELFRYDVVIVGDVRVSGFSPAMLDNLREFVRERGGGVLFIAGPQQNPHGFAGTALETLLPVELAAVKLPSAQVPITTSFQPRLTAEGRKGSGVFRFAENEADSVAIVQNLPGMFWLAECPELKAGAVSWMVHPSKTGRSGALPVIAMQRYGNGRVLFHATPELWRWRYRVGDLYYAKYWIQAIRYLCRTRIVGQDRRARLTVDRAVYQRSDPVQFRLQFLDERLKPPAGQQATVVIERRGDAQRRVPLEPNAELSAIYEGQILQLPEGSYRARVESPVFEGPPPKVDFRVEAMSRETQWLRMDRADLAQSAARTGGQYYPLLESEGLPRELPPGQPVPLKSDDPKPIWNHGLWLAAFALLLTAEWLLRRRWKLA